MARILCSFQFLLLIIVPVDQCLAQNRLDSSQDPPIAVDTPHPAKADIVVRSLRLREDEDLAVTVRPPSGVGQTSRVLGSEAARFTQCAGLPGTRLLRAILDGKPDTKENQKALHNYIMRERGCYGGPALIVQKNDNAPYFGVCNAYLSRGAERICRVTYDRGALYELALQEYAPELMLSRSNTFDKATRTNFLERENDRNSERIDTAREYFFTAACMVQIRPEYALAMLREEPGTDRARRLRELIISDGAPCVGGAQKVIVDPVQFRAFVAEAVYAWAVAVRRTGTLVSDGG